VDDTDERIRSLEKRIAEVELFIETARKAGERKPHPPREVKTKVDAGPVVMRNARGEIRR